MAKIYETPKDVEREILTDQAKSLRLRSAREATSGVTFLGLSFMADIYHARSPQTRGWLAFASMAATFLGAIDMVKSWITGSKAHDLELQRERLGPAQVVLPQELAMAAEPEKECAPCKLKKFGELHQPKTLAEHAEKTPDSGIILS